MNACLLFLQVSYPLHDTDDETVKVSMGMHCARQQP